MSPSVVAVVSTVLCAVLALASGQTRKLVIGGIEYSSHDLRIDNNAKILAFYGIPYARQPVGRFRFTRPEPLSKIREWGLRDDELLKYYKNPPIKSKSCPQVDPFRNRFDQDLSTEDCLRVDLYILEDLFYDQATSNRKYGMSILLEGFEFKSGVAQHLNPVVGGFKDQKDVGVLAVVHYRLGALGFLTTEDDEGPANLGLWDQSEALKFLKEQVVNGAIPQVDQQRISLLGFGSGGISASYHTLNPVNKPMFSAALISGGSALSPDANIRDARDRAFEFGQHVGCNSGSTRKLINCLRNADIQKIVEVGDGGHFLFGPVVDVNHTRDITRSYILDHPQRLLERETFDNVRGIIYGFPKNAGSLRYYTQVQARTTPHDGRTSAPVVDNSIDERIRYFLTPFQSHGDTSRALAASVKFLYFRNYTDDELTRNQTLFDSLMIDALTDYLSVAPVISAAHLHASKKLNQRQSGVYIYFRDAERELSTFSSKLQVMTSAQVKYGTAMDDLLQFVGVNGITAFDSGSEDRLIRVWSTIVSGLFGKVDTEVRDYGGIQDYKPNVPQVYYITALRGKGSIEPFTVKYREPSRIFWSKFVPTIGTILDDISKTSRDRHETSKMYRNTTLGTSIPLAILVIVCLALGALLWRAKRSASSSMSSSVHFQKVSQNDP